jgi:hypothetical protein
MLLQANTARWPVQPDRIRPNLAVLSLPQTFERLVISLGFIPIQVTFIGKTYKVRPCFIGKPIDFPTSSKLPLQYEE